MPKLLDILLQRNDSEIPWGFQVRGGLDFGICPVISSVTFGTLASQYLNAGDKVLEIENQKGSSLLESEINRLIQRDQPTLQILVEKLPSSSETIQNRVPITPHRPENVFQITMAPNSSHEVVSEHEWIRERKKSANGTKQSTKIWLREANRDSTLGEYDLEVNFERTKYRENGDVDEFNKGSTSSRNQKRMQMMTENVEKMFREKIGEWLELNMLNGPTGKQQSNQTPAGDGTQNAQPLPPPPPSFPGTLPGRRIKTEIPERGLEPPSVIQNAMMTKDKKPFTYTPGGIDLSEIRSPKMQRRINRNACADEMPGIPAPTTNQSATLPPSTNSHFSAMQSQLPAQVLPSGGVPPPPPPPPPSGNAPEAPSFPPPPAPPATSAPTPKPNAGRPPLGFDPNELLARVNKSQPYVPPATNREEPLRNFKPQSSEEKSNFEPKQQKSNEIGQNIHVPLQNEPGHIYVPQVAPKVQNDAHNTYVQPHATQPTRGQLGSIYIPPVPTVNQEQSAPSPSSPFGYKVQPNSPAATPNAETKPQAPWVTVYRTPQSSATWANRDPESPKPANTRIIPIQVEGRDSPKPTTPSPQPQTTPPPFLQSQQLRQAQQSVRQQPSAQPQPANTRVIPIQVEGSSQSPASQQQRTPGPPFTQTKFNPMTPQSPTPFSPSQEKEQRPQWASVQPRPYKKEPELITQQRPQQANDVNRAQQPQYEYGTYNTAGVPLSQLRKMQLSDDDRALMDKFKSQVERQGNDIINDENSNPRYRGGYIPSRVFKALDESVDDEKYLHSESDPRYRGACIPSRAFRMLQSMTDTAGDVQQQVPKSPSRGPASRPLSGAQFQQELTTGSYVPPSEQQVQEPRKYTGGSIPSRSFKMLQAMTGNEVSAPSSGPPSGRETPVPGVNRWCPSPSPSPMDPFWGYYPLDPYLIYNYISDLNAAYGFPPPPPPSFPQPLPYSYYQPYQSYSSDNEEQGYSSTDELAQYYANYRRKFGYSPYQPNPERYTPSFNIPRVCVTPVQSERRKDQFHKKGQVCKPKEEREVRNEMKKNEMQSGEDDSPSSIDDESESESDTEVEVEENQSCQKGSLQTLKSVPNVNVYTSDSSTTVVQEDDQEEEDVASSEGESEVKEDEPVPHQLSVIFEESEHSDVESTKKAEFIRACSSTASESEDSCSTLDNGEDDSDNDVMDAEATVTVRLPLKLKFSRSDNDEDITTVIVGDSQVERDTMYNLNAKKDAEEVTEVDSNESEENDVSVTFTLHSRSNSVISVERSIAEIRDEEIPKEEEIPEKPETDAEIIVSLPAPKPSEAKEEEDKRPIEKSKSCESPHVEDDSSSSSVQSGDTVLKHREDTDEDSEEDEEPKIDSFKLWIEKENNKGWEEQKTEEGAEKEETASEDNSYKAGVGRLEEMISSLLETARDTMSSSMELSEKDLDSIPKSDPPTPLTKKDSQEESEEDDSGVTSDMSIKQMNSETDVDTESDYSELSKMTKFQRASTHSRLFKLLQEECERCGNEIEDDNSTAEAAPAPEEKTLQENLSLRKQKLTLPLNQTFSSEPESLSSSSGIASPSSPTISDRLVKELIHSLLNKKKGKKFRKLPLAKLRAAALKILQEEMDSYDTSPTSGDDGLFLSPMQKKRLHSKLTAKIADVEGNEPQYLDPVPESIYGENYYDYLDYYNTWVDSEVYGTEDYNIVPSRAFRLLREQTCSPKPIEGFTARCPRVTSKKNIQELLPGRQTPVVLCQEPDNKPQYERMSFAEKQERVSKVLEKTAKS